VGGKNTFPKMIKKMGVQGGEDGNYDSTNKSRPSLFGWDQQKRTTVEDTQKRVGNKPNKTGDSQQKRIMGHGGGDLV